MADYPATTSEGHEDSSPRDTLVALVWSMRGWHTGLAQWVYWRAFGQPDSTGEQSGYPVGALTNIHTRAPLLYAKG